MWEKIGFGSQVYGGGITNRRYGRDTRSHYPQLDVMWGYLY
jgi:hypothetical protein